MKLNFSEQTGSVCNRASQCCGVTTTLKLLNNYKSSFACAQEKTIVRVKRISELGSNASLLSFYTIKDALTRDSFIAMLSLMNQNLNILRLILKFGTKYITESTACILSYKIIKISTWVTKHYSKIRICSLWRNGK